jgi:hypothetical protein
VHCFEPNSVKLKWDIKQLRRDKTVRGEISAIFGGKKVELRETARAVTPFGGLAVFVEFLRRVGFAEQVREAMPFELKSPNAIPAVETYTAFVISVVVGARRFAQTGLMKADQALQRVLGIKRFPTDDHDSKPVQAIQSGGGLSVLLGAVGLAAGTLGVESGGLESGSRLGGV